MHEIEGVSTIGKPVLLEVSGYQDSDFYLGIKNLFGNSLKLTPADKVFFAYDSPNAYLAAEVGQALVASSVGHTILEVEYDGVTLPDSVSRFLLDADHNVVMLLFDKSIWHHPVRRQAKYEREKRIVTMPQNREVLASKMAQVDPQIMVAICQDLMAHIQETASKDQYVTILGLGGTHLQGRVKKVFFENGLYDTPATGGNFPAGEVSFGPMDGSVNGNVAADLKVKGLPPIWPNEEIRFFVNNGRVQKGNGWPEGFRRLMEDTRLLCVAEMSFGICPSSEVFADPRVIAEEKCLGTAHVGLGADLSFGGNRGGPHLDLVFCGATVIIGPTVNPGKGLVILKDGELNGALLSPETRELLGGATSMLTFKKR